MKVPDFLDTNVLVYAYDASDPAKQAAGRRLLRSALAGRAVVSTQVLAGFASTLLHKVSPGAQPDQALSILDALTTDPNSCPRFPGCAPGGRGAEDIRAPLL